MFHDVVWTRKPYFNFNNLKSINVDASGNVLDITIQVNARKEHTYSLNAEDIKAIRFCIGYNKSLDKSVFFMITYSKDGKENTISFYLPRKYDKVLVEDVRKFALDRGISYDESKKLNSIIFVIGGLTLYFLIMYLTK